MNQPRDSRVINYRSKHTDPEPSPPPALDELVAMPAGMQATMRAVAIQRLRALFQRDPFSTNNVLAGVYSISEAHESYWREAGANPRPPIQKGVDPQMRFVQAFDMVNATLGLEKPITFDEVVPREWTSQHDPARARHRR